MRLILLAFILILTFHSGLVFSDNNRDFILVYDGNSLKFSDDNDTINIGVKNQGEDISQRILIQNHSPVSLHITNVRGGCGLSVPSWPRNIIKPGEEGFIIVRYDSSRLGNFTRNITIHANTSDSRTVIKLLGEIIP